MGWTGDQVVRNNTRNTGATIWDEDAVATQPIDSVGHDFHDQDLADSITACLNINGANQMLTNLNVGNFKILALADGTNASDGVNLGQLNAVASQITDIDGRITAIETADPFVAQSLQVAGEVNQISAVVTLSTVNTSIANRFLLTNNGTINLTITKPTAVRDIGPNYTIEGNIIVSNGATPGVVSIAGAAAGDVLGSNSLVANAKSLLSYIIHNRGGVYTEIYIWTAVTA